MEGPGGSGSLEGVHCNGHASGHSMLRNGNSRIAEQAAPVNEGTHSISRAAQTADSAASGPPDQAARQADSSPLQQTCFSEELVGIRVCFQLVDLGRQLYVWAGLETGAQGCMCLASPPTGATGLPPTANLVTGGANLAAASIAQRLARKSGRSIAVAWALPDQPPMLNVLAERRIVQQLAAIGIVRHSG